MAYIGQSLTEGTRRVYTYVATASQTTFNAVYGVGAVDVYQNGVLLAPSDYTASDGTTVVLSTGAAADDEITVVCHNTFSVADTLTASQGGTFTGDVTFAGAFTSKGIDDNATSTAITLDSSGNLLVGKTADTYSIEGASIRANPSGILSGATVTRDGANVVSLNRLTSDGDILTFTKDGTPVGSIGNRDSNDLYINTAGGTGSLSVAGTETYSWSNNYFYSRTDNARDLGTASSRWKDLYLSGGVYLGGTGSANLLDDYEEGTWTPTAVSGITSFSIQRASYTKIGRLVYLQAYIASITGKSSSVTKIGGMPFTPATDVYSGGIMDTSTAGDVGYIRTNSASTIMSVYSWDSSSIHRNDMLGTEVGVQFIFSVMYETNA